VIVVDYARLTEFQAALRAIHQEIDTTLTELADQLDTVGATWTGAASDGFQDTMSSWNQGADDLRDRLAELHNMVGRAHDNQARAVRSNSAIWRARRNS
jgi:WXG100 family type VII secretion target